MKLILIKFAREQRVLREELLEEHDVHKVQFFEKFSKSGLLNSRPEMIQKIIVSQP